MSLRIIGAGVSRTGTRSLKLALNKLLRLNCYHMTDVLEIPDHVRRWHAALGDCRQDWGTFLAGYEAAVDRPAAAFWRELSAAFPDALVILTVRDPVSWWESVNATIFQALARTRGTRWQAMMLTLLQKRFCARWWNRDQCMAALEAHNEMVRAAVPADRLLVWKVDEGWQPLCNMLGVRVPLDSFPHVNTRADFVRTFGL